MLPVGLNKAYSSKEHEKRKLVGYEVHEHIGGGTFRYVYRAEWFQPSLRQHLAIQLLHKTGTNCKGERRHAEGNCILKYLNEHPNILGLIAWRGTHVNTQLVMPLYYQDL